MKQPRLQLGLVSMVVCVVVTGVLALLYRALGGPSDPIYLFEQAGGLLPFQDHYYGPVYFAALGAIHGLLPISWFAAGKLLSWCSLLAFLLLSRQLFSLVLQPPDAQLAMFLLAINPILITAGFTVATDLFGACPLLAAVLVASRARLDNWRSWLASGLLFGLAFLTRYASLGFALGAILGTLVLPSGTVKQRARAAMLLVIGMVAFPVVWRVFLLFYQGYIPANYNFIHLARALGAFQEFREVPDLISRYGSVVGVLTSHWSAGPRIALYGVKKFVQFPFLIAPSLLFVAAGFVVPGALLVATKRIYHGPWLGAFVLGTYLLGIGSRDWVKYYSVILPFCVILVAAALRVLSVDWQPRLRLAVAAALIAGMTFWTAVQVRRSFLDWNWTEVATARSHIERERDASTVMASTTAVLQYGSTIPYVRLDTIYQPGDSLRLADILRRHGVTHLVILQRHTLWEFPWLAPLLRDPPLMTIPGLQLDTLILTPERAAIYRPSD